MPDSNGKITHQEINTAAQFMASAGLNPTDWQVINEYKVLTNLGPNKEIQMGTFIPLLVVQNVKTHEMRFFNAGAMGINF